MIIITIKSIIPSQLYQQVKNMNTNATNIGIHNCKDAEKHQAQAIIHQLTLLSPSLDYLENPITLSNEYIASKNDEIEKLKGMKPIVIRVYSYMFKLQRDQIYEQLTNYTVEIENSITKATQLVADLNLCVKQLHQYTIQMDDLTAKVDFSGIVSVNKLKIATIEQKISLCKQQIARIDKFRTVTLHHLNDTVLLNNTTISDEKEYTALDTYFKNHKKLEFSVTKNLSRTGIGLLALAILNYLTATYHLVWVSTEYKESVVKEAATITSSDPFKAISANISQVNDMAMSLLSFLQVAGLAIAIPLIAMTVLTSRHGGFETRNIYFAVMVSLPPFVIATLIKSLIDEGESDVTSVPYDVINTIDFFSLGINGSYIMISLALLSFAAIFVFKAVFSSVKDAYDIFKKLPKPVTDSESEHSNPA